MEEISKLNKNTQELKKPKAFKWDFLTLELGASLSNIFLIACFLTWRMNVFLKKFERRLMDLCVGKQEGEENAAVVIFFKI